MPSKYSNKKQGYDFDRYVKNIKDVVERTVRQNHLRRFEEVVAPFETDIPMGVEIEETGDTITMYVGPEIGPTTTNLSDDTILTSDLFKFLDEGTSVRWAHMGDGFTNETAPNSLNTSGSSYDRSKSYLDINNGAGGIEARNFSQLIKDEYTNILRNRLRLAMSSGRRLL